MANTARMIALASVTAAILAGPRVSAHDEETVPNLAAPSHVRSFNPSIASVIQQAGERSATFRLLVETIDASDSYVYVDEGECPHDDRACLYETDAAVDAGNAVRDEVRAFIRRAKSQSIPAAVTTINEGDL